MCCFFQVYRCYFEPRGYLNIVASVGSLEPIQLGFHPNDFKIKAVENPGVFEPNCFWSPFDDEKYSATHERLTGKGARERDATQLRKRVFKSPPIWSSEFWE